MKLKRKNSARLKQFALLNASWPRHLFPGSRDVVRRERTGLRGYAQQNMAAVMIEPNSEMRVAGSGVSISRGVVAIRISLLIPAKLENVQDVCWLDPAFWEEELFVSRMTMVD